MLYVLLITVATTLTGIDIAIWSVNTIITLAMH